MKLSEFKKHIQDQVELSFILPTGEKIPAHFHITEVGLVSKQFIDCGGTPRTTKAIHLQVWLAQDTWHRLSGEKLTKVISQVDEKLNLGNEEVYIEYQTDTIGIYGVRFEETHFALTVQQTACLAEDHCGVSIPKLKIKLSELEKSNTCCAPKKGCC